MVISITPDNHYLQHRSHLRLGFLNIIQSSNYVLYGCAWSLDARKHRRPYVMVATAVVPSKVIYYSKRLFFQNWVHLYMRSRRVTPTSCKKGF